MVLVGCVKDVPDAFTESMVLGGIEVDVDTLNRGREAYMLNCYACHGIEGDGNGPASYALRPPPRNFAQGTFKFTGVSEGLPHDEDLARIIKGGLNGTPMLPWDLPEQNVNDIIQYIKTFSPEGEAWRDPDAELGTRIVIGEDPWKGREADAVARGNKIYHGLATCWSCHPAYVSRQEIADSIFELKKQKTRTFRDNLYRPEAKPSQYTVKRKGKEDYAVTLLPPDFMVNEMRVASTVGDLFRTLASGIGGTAMPAWKGALPDDDIWAMAHYVKHLEGWKGTTKVGEIKRRFEADNAPVTFHDDAEDPAVEGGGDGEPDPS